MRSPFIEIQFNRKRQANLRASKIDERALDDFIEDMTGDGCLGLLKWARHHAPHLLRILMVSFLNGQAPASDLQAFDHQCSSRSGLQTMREIRPAATAALRTAEREYISRIVSESRTLSEAACKLGISGSTLWRKRKLYGLG
jgi:hypothetical protein